MSTLENLISRSAPLNGKPSVLERPAATIDRSVLGKNFAEMLTDVSSVESQIPTTRSVKMSQLYESLATGYADDTEWADNTAYLYGCEISDSPLLYVGEWPTVRIAATGEIYTPEKQAYYKEISEFYREGRVKLYENELAQGTPPLEIINKIFDYNETLPEEFRKMSGWA